MSLKNYFLLIILIYSLNLLIIKDKNEGIILEKSYTCNYRNNTNIDGVIYIYSSNLMKDIIHINGIINPYKNITIYCYFYYNNNTKQKCNVTIRKLRGTNRVVRFTYMAMYIPYNKSIGIPKYVDINNKAFPIISYNQDKMYNIILVIVNFHNIYNYKQVIDVIEISKFFGVDKIVIYVTSSSLFIKNILFHYVRQDFVTLIPFCFNEELKYVHEKGQIVKINDALYRFMYVTKYIIFNDIDEVIVTNRKSNYISFLKSIDNLTSDIYLFKSKLFPYSSCNNSNSILKYHRYCFIERGYEKFIVGNLYKFLILSVHTFKLSLFPIKASAINRSNGYVRHTRYDLKTSVYRKYMCKAQSADYSLDYFSNILLEIYNKFENLFKIDNKLILYG